MDGSDQPNLLSRLKALPAAEPLLSRVSGQSGVYLVGGAVRDLLLGRAPAELDLVVEGDAQELARRLGGSIRAHGRFGTVTVKLGEHRFDLASARSERYPRPGALPEVQPASLGEDLRRRDFTVNALAMALGGEQPGVLSTVPGALEDLRAARLRVMHDDSFRDDPTRLFRLVRYASRLGFAPDEHTARLAREAIEQQALATISGTRIGHELRLLAAEPDPVAALGALKSSGLDAAVDPHLGLEDFTLAERALELLGDSGRRDLLMLAVALRGTDPAETSALLDRLGFQAGDRATIVAAASGAEPVAGTLAAAVRPSEIASAVAGAPPELVAIAGALGPRAAAGRWLDELSAVRLEITGDDLLGVGVAPGPQVGRALRAALAAKLDGRAHSREDQLEVALRAAGARG